MKRRSASTSGKYAGLFEPWEIAIAEKLVSRFQVVWPCLRREGREDLLQEVLIHWHSVRDRYEPGREASPSTYMARVVSNNLLDLVAERGTDKRKAAYVARSLDAPLGGENEDLTLLDVIADDQSDQADMDAVLFIPLKMRLSKAWGDLTPRQRSLCELRMDGKDMSEAAEALGISRDTAHEERKRIRAIFEKAGLKDYLG